MKDDDKESIFQSLKSVLSTYSDALTCTENTEKSYNLYTNHTMKNKKPLYFGGVKINNNFVSYHLMALYVYPELKNSISKELNALLKGKSCFNIKALEKRNFDELVSITKTCYSKYRADGYI